MGDTVVDHFGTTSGARRLRAFALGAVTLLVAATFIVASPTPPAEAASPCGPTINPIVCENQKPGTDPAVWDISGAGDPTIQGFATDISVNAGQRVDFKIDTDASSYRIDIYRTGWYQGLGARKIDSVTPILSMTRAWLIEMTLTKMSSTFRSFMAIVARMLAVMSSPVALIRPRWWSRTT